MFCFKMKPMEPPDTGTPLKQYPLMVGYLGGILGLPFLSVGPTTLVARTLHPNIRKDSRERIFWVLRPTRCRKALRVGEQMARGAFEVMSRWRWRCGHLTDRSQAGFVRHFESRLCGPKISSFPLLKRSILVGLFPKMGDPHRESRPLDF